MIFEVTTVFLLNCTEIQNKDRVPSERVLMALLLCDLPCFFSEVLLFSRLPCIYS